MSQHETLKIVSLRFSIDGRCSKINKIEIRKNSHTNETKEKRVGNLKFTLAGSQEKISDMLFFSSKIC